MGLIDDLLGKRVFIDTAPIIYLIEGNRRNQKSILSIFEANDQGKFQLHTSIITLTEVLVRPLQLGRKDLAKSYENILLNSPNLSIHELDIAASIKAAEIRAGKKLKTPDAFQIATALNCGADFFLTNDKALKSIKEIKVLILDDLI